MEEMLTTMLQFSLDIKGKLGFGNLFALDSCREFKQTKKLACKDVASAKQYFPSKGYFSLKSLLGSAKYVARSVSSMAYSVGQTPTSQSQARQRGGLCTREKEAHPPTALWL